MSGVGTLGSMRWTRRLKMWRGLSLNPLSSEEWPREGNPCPGRGQAYHNGQEGFRTKKQGEHARGLALTEQQAPKSKSWAGFSGSDTGGRSKVRSPS
jgi:hypothetical protein